MARESTSFASAWFALFLIKLGPDRKTGKTALAAAPNPTREGRSSQNMKPLRYLWAVIAVVFGVATLVAGGRVLSGSNPGYPVYGPLLIYNTTMGAVYIVTGILIGVNLRRGMYAAAAIFALNSLALAAVCYFYLYMHAADAQNGVIAIESLRAMIFRAGVWLVLFVGLVWLHRHQNSRENERFNSNV